MTTDAPFELPQDPPDVPFAPMPGASARYGDGLIVVDVDLGILAGGLTSAVGRLVPADAVLIDAETTGGRMTTLRFTTGRTSRA
ncbi:hypothetical protein FRACA_3970005 [Frankia canadensis]|uniref:Uncharacterized protein n=1 Tax=Frankia canadensis TaxID=1836972 RepID=A0A2I2KWC7_9ACTN|nr:hypothetical protein [Frankia canadensis]SNQ49965.1 hypothetical protein FRACA_3970005 [Frankia canadensis]SOU57255.1 hypothetical protein FRACA_3970005 [Frankia canadensis]